MQLKAFPSATAELSFDDMVPKATSTRRVAAAAFYHCLGMFKHSLMSVCRALIGGRDNSAIHEGPCDRQSGGALRSPENSSEVKWDDLGTTWGVSGDESDDNRFLVTASSACSIVLRGGLYWHVFAIL